MELVSVNSSVRFPLRTACRESDVEFVMQNGLIVYLLAALGGAMSMTITYLLHWTLPVEGKLVEGLTFMVGFVAAWMCFQWTRRRLLPQE